VQVSVDSSLDHVSERHNDVPNQHSLSYRLPCPPLASIATPDDVPFLRSGSFSRQLTILTVTS